MPLVLPGRVVTPIPLTTDQILDTARVVDYRFEVLGRLGDDNEALLGTLDGVTGGSVSFTKSASIKGGGTLNVTDVQQGIDWLNVRVRPVVILASAGGTEPPIESRCGVFIPAAPVEDWTDLGRTWSVELLDKNSILDQDIVTGPSGEAQTYSLPEGSNVIDAVVEIIQGAGESVQAVPPGDSVLANPMTWDAGTTRLKIINDLLDAANYFSLWVDGSGQFRVTPYTRPQDRPPVYALLAPFVDDSTSMMSPEWSRDRDIYSIPNRYAVIGMGDEETPPLRATATNVDPDSPYSYPSRGRWITQVENGVEAVDQAALDAYARRQLDAATATSSALDVKHLFLPDLTVNSTVMFSNDRAGLAFKCTVDKTTIPFDPLALCSTSLQAVGE